MATVRVDIYEDGEGGWLLEVVDEYWNSTVWDEPFASDRAALDEALKTIDEDGIESLIGAPPGTPSGAALLERRFGPSGRLFEEVACHP